MRRVVRMSFNPASVEAFLKLFAKKRMDISAFPGCSHLDLLRDKQDPCVFFTYSIWETEAHLDAYRQSDLFKSVWVETKKHFNASPLAWSMDLEWTSGS